MLQNGILLYFEIFFIDNPKIGVCRKVPFYIVFHHFSAYNITTSGRNGVQMTGNSPKTILGRNSVMLEKRLCTVRTPAGEVFFYFFNFCKNSHQMHRRTSIKHFLMSQAFFYSVATSNFTNNISKIVLI